MSSIAKKVLFVVTKSNWGGAQRYVFDLATHLPKQDFEVSVAFGQEGLLAKRLREAGVKTFPIASLQRDVAVGADFKSYFELYRLFKKEKPDVVHLNSSKAGGVGALAARMSGVPKIIFTSHGLAWDEDRNIFAKMFIYLASQLTFALCHSVITISEDTHRRAHGSVLIYNGRAPVPLLARAEARATLMLPTEGLTVGANGELTRNKGYRYLLDAVKLVKSPATFVIVSDGEERVALEQRIARESLPVRLAGFVPDAARLLAAFDIFVMPSVKEGLPYVLIEAGHAGLPVVASDIPGITDVIGDVGLLVPAKDPTSLAQALEKLLSDPALRQTLGKKLQERIQKEFSLDRMVKETAVLY